MKPNWLKIASIGLAVVNAGVALASSFVDDKKLDDKVVKAVAEALKDK